MVCGREFRYIFIWNFSSYVNGWPIYTSVDLAVIGLNNDLSPIQHQAIIWTNDGLFFKWNCQWNLIQNTPISIQENSFESGVSKSFPFCLGHVS